MKQARGFTLIELAIVLVIMTILIGGLAVPLSAQIQARRIAETRQTLEEAREAILGYAMTHQVGGRPFLPCPDTDGDGIENRNAGICAPPNAGWFPWVTLGTAAQDAWGNRLRYATHADLTSSITGFDNGSAPAPGNWNQVCSEENCPVVDVAADVPVVLVSHGSNGRGARNVNIPLGSPTPVAPPGTSGNEIENLDADNRFVSRTPSTRDDPNGEFDDLTIWLSFNVLISRVCPAGGCP